MDPKKKARLAAAGYTATTVEDFLGLSPVEASEVETRVALAATLKEARKASGLSQAKLGAAIGSTQANIARAEKGDTSVSIDLMLRAIYGTGATTADVFAPSVAQRRLAA